MAFGRGKHPPETEESTVADHPHLKQLIACDSTRGITNFSKP
jgi:hypothetical protein